MTGGKGYHTPTQIGPKGPLYAHQYALPRLPVPSLEETCYRYLRSVRPLCTDAEFANTSRLVQDFLLSGRGQELQSKLLKHAAEKNKYSSWFIDWWNDAAYLTYRECVVFNVSYFYQFKPLSVWAGRSPTYVAATLLTATLDFRATLVTETLKPEPSKIGPATDASMYPYLFNACRVPVKGRDEVRTFDPERNQHVVVVRRNQFFAVEVCDGRRRLSTVELDHQLQYIVQVAGDVDDPAVGALTSDNRDKWADARALLIANGGDAAVEAIESSIMVICLDHNPAPDLVSHARALWHGDGRNRWFDKPVQYIVTEDGKAGFLGEHAMMDGTVTLRMVNDSLAALVKNKTDHGPPGQASLSLAPPKKLHLPVTPQLRGAIAAAERAFDATVAGHDMQVNQFKAFGKKAIKKMGVSPDAFIQMAIQLAIHKTLGHLVGTYESVSTRAFLHGRTEVLRSCSSHAKAFVDAMNDKNCSDVARYKALQSAAAAHVEYARAAGAGRGVDRHLSGLKSMAGKNVPALFDDPIFSKSNSWRLSTSALASEFFDGWGFGEVVPDGFGVGYMVNSDQINCVVTSRNLGAETFCRNLNQSLMDIGDICQSARPKAKL